MRPTRSSAPILDAVADLMLDRRDIVLVQVEGHVDASVPRQIAVEMSEKLARAVVDALVARGVERARLRPRGFGGFCPLDAGAGGDAQARADDRRVQFKLVQADGESGAQLGCEAATSAGIVSEPRSER